MGVFGLRKYVEDHGVTRLVKEPCEGIHHLCLDMNGLLHTVYDSSKPTATATLEALAVLLRRVLHFFPPSVSLIIAFDGPAPLSKLTTQRHRRRSTAASVPKGIELSSVQIACGSTFMLAAERFVEALMLEQIALGKVRVEQLVIDGCTVPGEGESKIAFHLLRRAACSVGPQSCSYNPDEVTCIVGNDSDLVLNCIGCTPYHNFFVVNPYSFIMTCVGELLYHWAKPGNGVSPAFLPAMRRDFAFITLLAGGDHYSGIEKGVAAIWQRYRRERAAGNFAREPLINGNYTIHGKLLSAITHESSGGHRRQSHYAGSKNKRKVAKERALIASAGNPETGLKLLCCSLWSLATVCEGRCPDYSMLYKGEAPKAGALRCAASTAHRAKLSIVPQDANVPVLRPLQLYTAVMTNIAHMPGPVRTVLEANERLRRVTTFDSATSIVNVVSEIFSLVDPSAWSDDERILLSFGEPRCFVVSKDTEGSRAVATQVKWGDLATAWVGASFQYPPSVEALHFVTFGSKHRLRLALPAAQSQRRGETRSSPLVTADDSPSTEEDEDSGSDDEEVE